jgi:hypothetical protein
MEREISKTEARKRLAEAIEKAGCKRLIARRREGSGLLEKTMIGEESDFIEQYRAFHGQLREKDRLEIEAEVRGKYRKHPLIKMMLYTSDGQKKDIAFTTAIGGLGFESRVLYDNL